MKHPHDLLHSTLFLLHLVFILFTPNVESQNHSVSAIFVFGDSLSDPGNNNYIATTLKGNFKPYGRDFPNQIPTGRFTNGLLVSDFVARYLGVKDTIPAYLDPSLTIQDLMTGVSFASSGTGYDPLTPKIGNVIPVQQELENFKEYQAKLAAAVGTPRMKEIIANALYIVTAGTNDFVINYFMTPIRRKQYTLPAYMDFLMKTQIQFLQDLWDLGARRIGVSGIPPLGCLPVVITLFSDSANEIHHRGCLDYYLSVGRNYNVMLLDQLNNMQSTLAPFGSRIGYFDFYGPISDAVMDRKYGFEEVLVGCCGTGLLEAAILCNPKSYVCPDASKYAFFDSIHPTEKMYDIVFQVIQPTVDYLVKN